MPFQSNHCWSVLEDIGLDGDQRKYMTQCNGLTIMDLFGGQSLTNMVYYWTLFKDALLLLVESKGVYKL